MVGSKYHHPCFINYFPSPRSLTSSKQEAKSRGIAFCICSYKKFLKDILQKARELRLMIVSDFKCGITNVPKTIFGLDKVSWCRNFYKRIQTEVLQGLYNCDNTEFSGEYALFGLKPSYLLMKLLLSTNTKRILRDNLRLRGGCKKKIKIVKLILRRVVQLRRVEV